jgi:3-methyl-2-oxobutanoate hydroxymethyltransferase
VKKVMVTCYDFSFSKILSAVEGLDYLLVGDSLGMVLYGDSGTQFVSTEEMCRHIQAVARGREAAVALKKPLIIGDMVAGSDSSVELALKTAEQMKRAGAEMIKLEGPKFDIVRALKKNAFSVCGHIGLTPQSIHDFKLQGKRPEEAARLMKEAEGLMEAGIDLLVLEMIPAGLAEAITARVSVPTIGIGAGPHVGGQVLVLYDLLGMNPDFRPKFLKTYEKLSERVSAAIRSYQQDVINLSFPSEENYYA